MKTKRILIILLTILASIQCFAHDFKITHYTPANGLQHQYVFDAVQDTSGYLLFNTNGGTYLYDGTDFTKITERTNNNFGHYLFYRDVAGQIFALSGNFKFPIQKYYNGKFRDVAKIDEGLLLCKSTADCWPKDFEVLENGKQIYIVTSKVVFAYKNNKWFRAEVFLSEDNNQINNVVRYQEKLLIASSAGILEFRDTTAKSTDYNDLLPGKVILSIEYDSETNQLWILGDKWFGYISKEKFYLVHTFKEMPKDFPVHSRRSTIFKYKQHIFYGNKRHAYYYNLDDKKHSELNTEFGVLGGGVHSIIRDRENNVWLSSARGVNKFVEMSISNYGVENGLLESEVSSIERLDDKTIIFGHNYGLTALRNGVFKTINLYDESDNPAVFTRILDMQKDKNGLLWLTANSKGVGYLTKDLKVLWIDHNIDRAFSAIYIDDFGKIFVGTNDGLFEVGENNLVEHITNFNVSTYARKIFKISKDTLGICSSRGLYLFVNNSIHFTQSPDSIAINIYAGIKTKNGEILLGTERGIFTYHKGKYLKHNFNQKINFSAVYFLHEIDDRLFIGTNRGLFIQDGDHWVNYNSQNGLSGDETNRDAFLYDDEGYIWVGTNNGLSKAKVSALLSNYQPPKVIFKEMIDKNGVVYQLDKAIDLSSENNFFTIHFRALSFVDESSNMYKVKVVNLEDASFNEVVTSEPFVQLSNQLAGSYKIEVAAKNFQSGWGPFISSAVITINGPYYYAWWFFAIIGSFMLLVLYSINKYSLQIKYAIKLKNEVDQKTAAIRDYSDRFKLISRSVTDVIWMVDKDLNLTFVSDSFCELFGLENLKMMNTDDDVIRFMKKIKIRKEDMLTRETLARETVQRTKNNKKIWTEVKINPILNEKEEFNGFVAITRDISARKSIEQIRAEAVTETSEIERRRIARELHDHIGQILASIKLRLEIFARKHEDENVDKAKEQVLILGDEVQNIIRDMNPLDKSDKNFEEHLCDLYRKVQASFNITVYHKHSFKSEDISSKKGLIIYRIIQESLTNVIKHSGAKIAKVKVVSRKNQLSLSITDNGCGMEKSNNSKSNNKFGIVSMEQRIKLLNGKFTLQSKPNWGTSVFLVIPMEELKNV